MEYVFSPLADSDIVRASNPLGAVCAKISVGKIIKKEKN